MCDSWKVKRGHELTPAEVRVVFGKIGKLDVVRLSGGEPFLRTDLLEIAQCISDISRPAVLHVTTNGSFPDRVESFCRDLKSHASLRLMVSFDGMAAVHDRNRGRAVTFNQARETVQRLAALGPDCVQVSINHTIFSDASMADHQELRLSFEALGVDVQWVLAYDDSAMYGESRRGTCAEDLIVPRGYPLNQGVDKAAAVEFVERELQRNASMRDPALRIGKRYYLTGLHDRLRNVENPKPKPKCVALRSHLRLLPDGSVPVCQFNTETVGNLVSQSFEQVWTGFAARGQRTWVDACPGCWAECEVVPNALYSGDIWRGLLPVRLER